MERTQTPRPGGVARLTPAAWIIVAAAATILVVGVAVAAVLTAGIASDKSSTASLRLLSWIEPILGGIALGMAVRAARSADERNRSRKFRQSAIVSAFAVLILLEARFG